MISTPKAYTFLFALQKELINQLQLTWVDVDYCAFGREEKKPTRLWTNSAKLADHLRCYRCDLCCTQGQKHTEVKGNTSRVDFSVIPLPLAEEVARFVESDLWMKRVQRAEAASPR